MINNTCDLLKELLERLENQQQLVLVIEGTSAAGKSTLAAYLAERLDGAVMHCDDFFLPPLLRTQQRLQEPGGNIHYERMKAEVTDKLPGGLNYMCYDCKIQDFGGEFYVPEKPLMIVEGAYAMHPYFGPYYDFSVFLDVDSTVQMERITKRNPNPAMFRDKWIPLERAYFQAFSIREKADMVLDTTGWK